jgi:hypothetical protein
MSGKPRLPSRSWTFLGGRHADNEQNDRLDAEIIRLERKSKFLLYRELEAESRKAWLVQGLLGSGEASAVYGVAGLWMAANGVAVQQGAVLYVALERKKLVERRAIAFRERHAISDALFAIVGGVFDFRNPQNVASVVETARQVEDETGETLAERP